MLIPYRFLAFTAYGFPGSLAACSSSQAALIFVTVMLIHEIEARILAPVLEALGKEFGQAEVLKVTRKTIVEIARQQGR